MTHMKSQLPYVLRYMIAGRESDRIDFTGVARNSRDMLQAIVTTLGAGWKGVILSYGMIVYQTRDRFLFATELLPQAQIVRGALPPPPLSKPPTGTRQHLCDSSLESSV